MHMTMKRMIVAALVACVTLAASAQSKVFLTRQINPEALVKIYKALGVKAKGRVAVKVSTGEGSNPNYLKPERIDKQHGTHTIDWAEKIGLGSKKYKIINIDK